MRETKDQTIARLEKVIGELKTELSELKKERKRLNYAVERLEKQIKNGSNQSTKEDIKRIKELEQKEVVLSAKIDELNNSLINMRNRLHYFEQKDEDGYNYTLNGQRENLIRFHRGEITRTTDNSFFAAHNLITTINPRTGEYIWLFGNSPIEVYLNDNAKYQEAMKQLEEYKTSHKCDGKALMNEPQHIKWLDGIGRELLKEYIHFFF